MSKQHIIFIYTLIYIFVGILVNYFICNKIYNNITEYYENDSNKVIGEIKTKFKELSIDDIENPEILDKIFDFDDGYGFVYRDNIVIYEMNLETTKKYKNSTTRELFNDYSQDSGTNLADDMTHFIFKEEGTEFLIKNNDYGMEMITWKNVEIYDKNYVIGVSLPIKNILKKEGYYFYRNIFAIATAFIYVMSMIFYYIIIKKNKKTVA